MNHKLLYMVTLTVFHNLMDVSICQQRKLHRLYQPWVDGAKRSPCLCRILRKSQYYAQVDSIVYVHDAEIYREPNCAAQCVRLRKQLHHIRHSRLVGLFRLVLFLKRLGD